MDHSPADAQALFSSIMTLVQNGNSADLDKLLSANPAPFVQSVINNGLAQEWFKYGPQGETALHIACRRNDMECARILISHGASINVANSVKRTPLDVCSPQNAQALRALAEGGNPSKPADALSCSPPGSDTPLGTSPPSAGLSNLSGTPATSSSTPPSGQAVALNGQQIPLMPMAPVQGDQQPAVPTAESAPAKAPANPTSSSPASAIASKNMKEKAEILRGLKDFGLSLFFDGTETEAEKEASAPPEVPPSTSPNGAPAAPQQHVETGKGHSRFRDVPKNLHDVLVVLETRLKANVITIADIVACIDKYDSSEARPEELTQLVSLVNAQNKMLDAYDRVSTQTVVDAVVTYFEMLPSPVIPVKYYSTLLYVANVQSSRALMAQSRILFNYLPTISRVLLSRFGFFFLKLAGSPGDLSTETVDMLSKRFFKYFFRGTDAIAEDFIPTSSHHAFLLEELFANAFIRNLPYVTMQVDQPDLVKIRHPDDKQLTIGDIVLFAVTLYDFQSTNTGKNTLSFSKNERVRLVNLHRNDWLEGMLNKKRGFLPKAYVKLILHNNPPSRLKTVPGMPTMVNLGAASATAASGVKPGAPITNTPMNPMMPQMVQQQHGGTFTVNHLTKGTQFPNQPAAANPMAAANPAMMMGINPMAVQQRPMMFNQGMMNGTGMMPNPGMVGGGNMMANPQMMSGNPQMMNMMMMMNSGAMGMMPNPQMPQMGAQMNGQMGQRPVAAPGAAAPSAADAEIQRRMEQLRIAEEQLAQQQMQINMQMQMQQMQQAKLQRKAQELAKAKLDSLKKDNENWQINYDELELEQKIGEGGFGEVYRAKWRGTTVAVKTLKHKGPSSHFTAEEAERYKREVSILRALNHPNLVLFLGASLEPVLCMISEFMFGGSLYDLLYKKKKIPDHTKRCVLALDIAKAMAFLHNHKPPIVHRDLKSLNILLDEKGEHAKVGDVGLAVNIGKGELKGAVGTYSWMPPEMMKGQAYTEKADVYSYGLVLYEMVTGKLPFAGMPPQQISLRVAVYNERPPLPSSVNSKWKELITACWGADDTKRPSFITILDMLSAIEKK